MVDSRSAGARGSESVRSEAVGARGVGAGPRAAGSLDAEAHEPDLPGPADARRSRWDTGLPDPDTLRETARQARALPREPMTRGVKATVAGCVLVWLVTVGVSYLTLPERVPTHWSSGTTPDGWSSRAGAVLPQLVTPVAMNALFALIPLMVLRWPQGINAPNKEYWLATPQRLRRFERLIREDMSLLSGLCMLLFAAIAVVMAVAARRPGGEMPGMFFAIVMIGFVAGMIAFLARVLGGSRYRVGE